MPYRATNIAKRDREAQRRYKDRVCYVVDPQDLYEKTLRHFKKIIRADESELEQPIDEHTARVRQLTLQDVRLAERKRSEVSAGELPLRAAVLELARLWFTRSLKLRTGKPIHLRITSNPDWRLQ